MAFRWLPYPHVDLLGDEPGSELALNVVLYVLTLSLLGAITWLGAVLWTDRER
jgi:hypothetical protein